jgi:hypothetical protein
MVRRWPLDDSGRLNGVRFLRGYEGSRRPPKRILSHLWAIGGVGSPRPLPELKSGLGRRRETSCLRVNNDARESHLRANPGRCLQMTLQSPPAGVCEPAITLAR